MSDSLHIGFTGTSSGPKWAQAYNLLSVLSAIKRGGLSPILHHGDCIGADHLAHRICTEILDIPVIIHPPTNSSRRAFGKGAIEMRKCKDYLVRNHDIVDETSFLLVVPELEYQTLRSGTWATFRYARRWDRRILIFWPDGKMEFSPISVEQEKLLHLSQVYPFPKLEDLKGTTEAERKHMGGGSDEN